MTRASRGSIEADEPASFQDPVEDGGGQVLVVQDLPPFIQRLVGGEDHGALAQVPDGLSLGWSHGLRVDIHGRLHVGVPEEFFLHSQVRPHGMDQRGERVPERVPPDSTNTSLFRRRLDVIGKENAPPTRAA